MSDYKYLIEKKLVEYSATPNYGLITEKSITLDDISIFGYYLISYRVHSIRCWQNKQLGIIGIQLHYKDRDTNEDIISVNKVKNDKSTLVEFILDPLEFIIGLTIYKSDLLNGFSIKTNKKREKLFGYDLGDKIIPEEFEEDKNVILGFFFTFEPNMRASSIGCYYLNKTFFSLILYSGILYLRIRLKDEKFKNEIEKKLDKLDKPYVALFKMCLLPNIQFYGVLKYSLS
jgi:hypothetical protein